MKKLFFILVVLFCAVTSFAQTTYRLPYDTVIVYKSNNVGFLKGDKGSFQDTLFLVKLKYNDGSESAGYVLTTDANGNASWQPAAGGGGNPNSNIGTGYRWAVPNTNDIKTFLQGYGLILDSATNTLSARVDTLTISTIAQLQHRIDSLAATIPAAGVTSVATNNGSGITGGTITTTGTIAADTTNVLSTKYYATSQIGDSINAALRNKTVFTFTQAVGAGDSYMAGSGLSSVNRVFVNQAGARMGFGVSQAAIGGASANMSSYFMYNNRKTFNTDTATFMMLGYNTIRASDSAVKGYLQIFNGYKSAIANQFLSTAVAANSGSVTAAGTWANANTFTSYRAKAAYLGGQGRSSSTAASTLDYTASTNNFVFGYIGGDGSTLNTGTFNIYVDAVLYATVNSNNQTTGLVGSGDVTTYPGIQCVYVVSGLTNTSHTIRIEVVSGNVIADYFGYMKDPANCAPFFAVSIQKNPYAGWGASGTTLGSNMTIDEANYYVKRAVNEFKIINKFYPVYWVDCNKYIDLVYDYQTDNIHWNDTAHTKASYSLQYFINNSLSAYNGVDITQGNYLQRGDFANLGNVTLKYTTNNKAGLIKVNDDRLIHTYPGASNSLFVGQLSGNFTNTAINNSGFGYGVLTNLTTGGYNTVGGILAGGAIADGQYNTIWGAQSGTGITSGLANTITGRQAGISIVSTNFSSIYGYQAGFNATGGNNTYIGTLTANTATSATFSIAMGSFVDLPSATTTGQLNIGNVLYGRNLYSTTVASSTPTTTGSIGIGLTTPTARFHLPGGSVSASTAPLKFTSGTNLTTPEAGAMEYTTPQLFFTNGTAVRQEIQLVQQSRVSTQFDKTNETLANITELTANVAAAGVYRFEATLYTTSDVSGGIQVAIGGTATATAIVYEGLTTNAGLTVQSRATALGTSVGAVTAVTASYVKITGTITVNAAGTLVPQVARNAAAGTTSVLVGSTFVVNQIP